MTRPLDWRRKRDGQLRLMSMDEVRETFAGVYHDHRQGLFTVALAITRDRASAEDAIHEAFVRLLDSAGKERLIHDHVAYAYGAVRRAAIDQVRRRGNSLFVQESIFEDVSDETPCAIETAEADAVLRDALEQLPEAERSAVVMRIYGELTFQQISAAIGDPLSTISSRYQRALQRLRASLSYREALS